MPRGFFVVSGAEDIVHHTVWRYTFGVRHFDPSGAEYNAASSSFCLEYGLEFSRRSLPFRVLMVLLLLAAGIGGSAFPQQAPLAESLIQLEEAVRREPDNAESRRRLGAALHRSGQLQLAIEQYTEAIRLLPGEVELYLDLAGVFETANLTREAEELLLDTSEAFPGSVAAAVELAETRFASGKVEQALEAFEAARMAVEAASDQEHAAFIYRRIGEMHVHMIEFDDALAAYANALRLAPVNADIHLALGKLYLRRNRLDEALDEYGLALAQDPENLPAYEGIAEAYLRLEQFERSIAAAEIAIGIDPEHLGAHYLRATAMIRSGRDDAARLALDVYRNLETEARIREQREREIGGIYKAALAEALDGNGPDAVRLLREGIETHPDASELHMNLGATLNSLGRYSEAIEVFERMIDSGMRDDFLIRRSLAEARERQGDADR